MYAVKMPYTSRQISKRRLHFARPVVW